MGVQGVVSGPQNDVSEFNVFDKDHNGYLDTKEISKLNKTCGTSYADPNNDGMFTLDEFKKARFQARRDIQAAKEVQFFDTNADGLLNKKELGILNACLGQNTNIDNYDYDRNGGLDVNEYKKAGGGTSAHGDSFCETIDDSRVTSNPINNTAEEQKEAEAEFKFFDADGNGHLKAKEMQVLNQALGTDVVIRFHDTNKDGQLSMDEYRKVGGTRRSVSADQETGYVPGGLASFGIILGDLADKISDVWDSIFDF